MILFGHMATAVALGKVMQKTALRYSLSNWTKSIDYRLVLIGSLLPDIIDKPIGIIFFWNFHGDTRIIAHTLLFQICFFMLAAFYKWKYKKLELLILSFFGMFHLIQDRMWKELNVLLWPFYKQEHKEIKKGLVNTMESKIHNDIHSMYNFSFELIGIIAVLCFLIYIYRKRGLASVKNFARSGTFY